MSDTNGREPYFYSAYGVKITSDISLNDLVPAQSGEDVNINLKKLTDSFLDSELKDSAVFDRPGCVIRVCKNAICYQWENIGTALVRNGNEVLVDPLEGVEGEEFSPFITGAILAILLHQRGFLVLHASAVVIGGEAAIFLGDKGAGKSTLAAHLQKSGYEFITDDLVPVILGGDRVQITPGFPRIKLWSDSVESLGMDWRSMPQVSKFADKRLYQSFDNFSTEPINLGRIFVLKEESEIKIEKLELKDAFIEIARNTYLAKYLQVTGQAAEHFQQCKSVISAVPVFDLKRPHDHDLLPEVISKIEQCVS